MKAKPKFHAPRPILVFCLTVALAECLSCGARKGEVFNVLSGRDIAPPRLLGIRAVAPDRVEISFDEPVSLVRQDFPFPAAEERNIVALILPSPLAPGDELALGGTVIDEAGNRMGFHGSVYGLNPHVPDALITELTTSGTKKSPDRVEIAALSDGDMAGLCLCDGTRTDFANRFVFPSCPVEGGDYVVVCWDGASQDDSRVFHAGAGAGLSQRNGVVGLYAAPDANARCLDCVVYANHNGTARSKFGTEEALRRASEVVAQGFWKLAPGEESVTGMSAVDSSKATATRSMARRFPYIDTDTLADWYVTDTRGSTFGGDNISPAYDKSH